MFNQGLECKSFWFGSHGSFLVFFIYLFIVESPCCSCEAKTGNIVPGLIHVETFALNFSFENLIEVRCKRGYQRSSV